MKWKDQVRERKLFRGTKKAVNKKCQDRTWKERISLASWEALEKHQREN